MCNKLVFAKAKVFVLRLHWRPYFRAFNDEKKLFTDNLFIKDILVARINASLVLPCDNCVPNIRSRRFSDAPRIGLMVSMRLTMGEFIGRFKRLLPLSRTQNQVLRIWCGASVAGVFNSVFILSRRSSASFIAIGTRNRLHFSVEGPMSTSSTKSLQH